MAKSLLILMLMTTQLLAGSGESVYLCISNDGTCCCIDAGPASCTCCHEQEAIQHVACCVEPGCEFHEDEAPSPNHHGFVGGDPCGCTHIPVTVSSGESITFVRPSMTTDVERLSLLLALPLSLGGGLEISVPSLHFRWNGPTTTAPNFALTVISTVVIRC